MPSTSLLAADRARRLSRLEGLADRLDSRFRLPGTSIRFGWDSLLGLIPVVGDLATTVPAAVFLLEGWRMGARKRTLARMGANSLIDLTLGGIPILGDIFDVAFKANRRNLAILTSDMARHI
ncbi:DUF4112 domain-containing protein [Nereida sp. MMG025]|uniref:DUF4112 domain-containing protein n=1 Tax=Nereida sp. MMG025 TaxID=2909981 RepID=UPI001F281D0F|nr:DUF4112 domain-containing protein [Nereida sp. MMG025]MCF6445864.1 DUF4112 domain-containing protein [Nereida sp. MMG025]